MILKLGADVEIDLLTGDEVAGKLKDAVTGSSARGRALTLAGSNSVLELPTPALPGDGVIRLGQPPAGSVWNVVTVTLLGADDHTVSAAKAALYVDADPANLNIASCLIPNITVPSFQAISKQTLWAHSSGRLCVNVSGSGGTQVVCTVGVVEYSWEEIFDVGLR